MAELAELAELTLDDAVSGLLDSSGNLTLSIGPTRSRQTYVIENLAVAVASNTKEPLAVAYQGPAADPNRIGSTYTGSNDSVPCNLTVRRGNFVTVRWTGGDAGARATLSIYGRIILDQ